MDLRDSKLLWCVINQRIYIASIVIGNWCAHDLDELLVPHSPIRLDTGLAEDLVNLSGAQLLSPFGEDVMQVLGGDDATLLLVVVPEGLEELPGDALLLAVGVHGVEEVGEGHLPALLPHVGAQLGDGGAHAQRAHRHRQLVDAVDVAGARVQVEALTELIYVLFFEVTGHFWKQGNEERLFTDLREVEQKSSFPESHLYQPH